VSNIKKKRAAIYTSITKGEKTLMRKIQRSDQSKRDNIQTKMRDSVYSLTRIMDNLQMIVLEKTPREVKNTSTT